MLNRYCITAVIPAMLVMNVLAEDPVPPVAAAQTNKATAAAIAQPGATNAVIKAQTATNIISLVDDSYRDPFWPKDYVPQKSVLPAAVMEGSTGEGQAKPAKPKVKWPTLKVRSINKTKDGTYIAFIDGIGIAEPGNTIKIKKEGYQFSWKVEAIEKSGIKLNQLDVKLAP